MSPALIDAMASGLPSNPTTIDFAEPGGLQRRHRAQRHRVVAGDDALDAAVALDERLHLLERLALVPVGALPGDHLQVRVLVEHVVKPAAAHGGVGVGLAARRARCSCPSRRCSRTNSSARQRGALVVVRHDLRDGDAGDVDLAVDQDRSGCPRPSPSGRPRPTHRRRRCRGRWPPPSWRWPRRSAGPACSHRRRATLTTTS